MLYTFEQGDPSQPAILFVHGGGLSHKSWKPVIDLLPDFFCLAPDLPGHGQSRQSTFSLEGSAAELASIIREKTPHARAHVVGLSLGGAVVLTLLRLHPEVADHVILTGSSGRLPNWLVQISLPMYGMLRFMKPETLVRSTMKQQHIPEEYYADFYEDLLSTSTPEALRPIYSELTKLELPATISSPLLVCAGEKEPGASKLYGQIALRPLKKYPSARGVLMPGGAHVWGLQYPDVFAEMVRAWVTDKPLPQVLKPVTG
jgi:pimeloyl-ACP methyl ester carboxylesterase